MDATQRRRLLASAEQAHSHGGRIGFDTYHSQFQGTPEEENYLSIISLYLEYYPTYRFDARVFESDLNSLFEPEKPEMLERTERQPVSA